MFTATSSPNIKRRSNEHGRRQFSPKNCKFKKNDCCFHLSDELKSILIASELGFFGRYTLWSENTRNFWIKKIFEFQAGILHPVLLASMVGRRRDGLQFPRVLSDFFDRLKYFFMKWQLQLVKQKKFSRCRIRYIRYLLDDVYLIFNQIIQYNSGVLLCTSFPKHFNILCWLSGPLKGTHCEQDLGNRRNQFPDIFWS